MQPPPRPSVARLDPKLTKRGTFPQHSQETLTTSRSGFSQSQESSFGTEYTESSTFSDAPLLENTNPRIHLLHNGAWIPKKFEVGRHVPRTGIWDCCGDPDHFSLYCESLEARVVYAQRIQSEDEYKEQEMKTTSKRRAQLLSHISEAEKTLNEQVQIPLTREEKAIEEACSEEGSFNAPMLVAWLQQHVHEEPTTLNGLKFLRKHLNTGEGCFLMQRHGVMQAITKIQDFYHNQPPIQLLVITILQQLLDCNYTRAAIIAHADVVRMSFAIAHYHMNSPSHLEPACKCLTQCARSEAGRVAILELNVVPYMINFCRKYSKNASIVRSTLMLFLWVTTDQARLEYICSVHGVNTAIQCLKRHQDNTHVISPAILFLSRAALNHPESMALILKKNAAALVIKALKIVFNDEALQLAGLKLLQTISRTSEGWKQISAVHAGWQSITAGTVRGDALVHDLPGEFNNPGWSLGDTPYLPLLAQQKLAAGKTAQSGIQQETRAAWTPSSLREYMGLSMAGQSLEINTQHHTVYFELLCTLDMLPKPEEPREQWFKRVHAYEVENEVKIEDMVSTVQEMRRRDAVHKKMASKGIALGENDEILGTVKEVYVNGQRITGDLLQATDADVDEALEGVI